MIKQIYLENKEQEIKIKGWVISNRGNKKIRFVTINDGTTFKNLQVVVKGDDVEVIDKARIGASVEFWGTIKLTPESKQPLELESSSAFILKNADEDFPIQKQGMSREVLRELPHLRHRTNLFRAVMKIRSTLTQEIHAFFMSEEFINVASPIITENDGEGAGEAFLVDSEEGNFFGKKATLGVTGQLHAESYAVGFGKVYTFAPTFRAENSHTQKHAAEFWMIEPEIAFQDKTYAIDLADRLLKNTIKKTMEKHLEEFEFLNQYVDETLVDRLNKFIESKVQTISYTDAITKLKEVADIFDEKRIEFGLDLATEHEKYIAEKLFGGPVVVTDYPKDIKAFYMKQNEDGKTVGAFDMLVPGIGELIGGSERETDYEKLLIRVKEMGISVDDMQWYLDLRRYGQAQSVGFGIGFERLVMFVTGIENIRDVIPYPRTPNNLKM